MANIRHTSRLRLRDSRDLYLLLGECRSLGNDGIAWRRHLVTRLRMLLGGDMAHLSDNVIVGKPHAPQGWVRPLSIIDDWQNKEDREVFWHYVRLGRPEDNPMFEVLRGGPGVRAARRCDYVTDDRWYGSSFYREFLVQARMDDFVCGIILSPQGSLQSLVVQRSPDRQVFQRRHAHFMKAIMIELRQLQPHELYGVEDSALTKIPRRMQQVLACLLAGHTVKETAELLSVSAHTVQEHVKRLYKRSGTKNRAELADCYRGVAPTLISTPLDDFPDHQQQIQQATRNPWPAETAATDSKFARE